MSRKVSQEVFEGKDPKWSLAAVDPNGECFLFTKESMPIVSELFRCWIMAGVLDCSFVGGGFCAKNWQNSLIEKRKDSGKYTPESNINTIEVRVDKY